MVGAAMETGEIGGDDVRPFPCEPTAVLASGGDGTLGGCRYGRSRSLWCPEAEKVAGGAAHAGAEL